MKAMTHLLHIHRRPVSLLHGLWGGEGKHAVEAGLHQVRLLSITKRWLQDAEGQVKD